MKAVIDRIVDGVAVMLLGEDEHKVEIPVALLPEGAREGSWLKVSLELDQEGEMQQREKISNLLEKLRNKNK